MLNREEKTGGRSSPSFLHCEMLYLPYFMFKQRIFEIHTNEYVALPPENGKAALGNGIHPPKIKGDVQAREDNTLPSTLRLAQPQPHHKSLP